MVSLQPCRGNSANGFGLRCPATPCRELCGNGFETRGWYSDVFREITYELQSECWRRSYPREEGRSIRVLRFFHESAMGLIHVRVSTRSRLSRTGGFAAGTQRKERTPQTI